MSSSFKKGLYSLAASFLMAGAAMPLHADDTEIYFGAARSGTVVPNILFLVDTSGSMTYKPNSNSSTAGITSERKIEILKTALRTVLEDTSGMNVGLMRFNYLNGGNVLYPVKDIEASAAEAGVVSLNYVIEDGADDAYQIGSTTRTDSTGRNQNGSSLSGDMMFDEDTTVGLRYQNVNIPRNAVITNAYLDVGTVDSQSGNNYKVTLNIAGELSTASANFSSGRISSRTPTSHTVSWTIDDDWQAKGTYRSPDLKSVIQEIVNQSGWCGGGAISLIITATDSSGSSTRYRRFTSYESTRRSNNYTPIAPVLNISFDESSTQSATTNTCYSGQTTVQVSSGNDDAEESSSGATNLTDNDLDAYTDTGTTHNSALGIRFERVNVPNGVTVNSAILTMTASSDSTAATSVRAYGIAQDDAVAFTGASNVLSSTSTTPRTSSSTLATLPVTTRDSDVSINVTSAVQEIVNRGGWLPLNHMGFILTGTAGDFHAYSYEGGAGSSARLRIVYTVQGRAYQPGTFTVRQKMESETKVLNSEGGTPTTKAMYEAYQYLSGGTVYYGKNRNSTYTSRVSTASSYSGSASTLPSGCPASNSSDHHCANESISGTATYITPITDTCQVNEVVLLSDGDPNQNSGVKTLINALTGKNCQDDDKECAYDLAEYMHSDADLNPSLNGYQTAKFNTIGFDINSTAATQYLQTIANRSEGRYFPVDDADGLVKAFYSILGAVKDINTTFVSAGVSVNQYNRLTHRDELYFALFKPDSNATWLGNLKRYRLEGSTGKIKDATGADAVVPETGLFINSARSWWSTGNDGNEVDLGGAASLLTNARTVYSNISGSSNVNLTLSGNRVRDANSAITQAMLGVSSSTERTKVLNWAIGQDVNNNTTTARKTMGDPLHSQPTLVTYRSGGNLLDRVFVGTNDGYLQFFNTADGTEQWAFVPQDLLPNLTLFKNGNAPGSHPYGLDGPMTLFLKTDANHDGVIDVGTDTAYLMVGMRRGGRNYYVLDVSNPTSPQLKYVIRGGSGTAGTPATDYRMLGQTWSRPIVGKIKLAGVDKSVWIVGGGYDTNQDAQGVHASDSMGNTVFMFDVDTGEVVWNAKQDAVQAASPAGSLTNMTNSIPADIAVVDFKGTGYFDHLYVSDTGGQVFRFDINPAATSRANIATGGRLAHIQERNGEVSDNRRFFYAPDIAPIDRQSSPDFVAVSLGSGLRAHPLDTEVQDMFVSLRDYGVLNSTGSIFDADIDLDHLVNIDTYSGDSLTFDPVTGATVAGGDGISDAVQALEYANSTMKGWYLRFADQDESVRRGGEKVLGQSISFDNKVYFTTYYPTTTSTSCEPSEGRNRTYVLDLIGGDPMTYHVTLENSGAQYQDVQRFTENARAGIATGLSTIVTGEGTYICEGTQCYAPSMGGERLKSFKWQHNND